MSMMRPTGEDPATKVARVVSRRKFLDRSLRVITTGAVGLFATGRIFSGSAAADGDECFCAPPRGVPCTDCPPGRGQKKCPDGYKRCRTVDGVEQCPGCVYEIRVLGGVHRARRRLRLQDLHRLLDPGRLRNHLRVPLQGDLPAL